MTPDIINLHEFVSFVCDFPTGNKSGPASFEVTMILVINATKFAEMRPFGLEWA